METSHREAASWQDVSPEQIVRALSAQVSTDQIILASGHRARVAEQETRVIVFPRDLAEMAEVLRRAESERWRVIPMGAGTWMEMGNRATAAHLFVSTAQMNRVLEYEPADLTATVEAGCTLAAFNAQAAGHRQFIPLDPFGDERSTLGAIIATASAGTLRAAYGTPRDWVIGMRVAHADGQITKAGGKVVKNVAGYDLCKLYTGSYGTLGMIGELSFKLRALPASERTIVCGESDVDSLCALVARILDSDLQPSAVELFAPQAVQLGTFANHRWVLALRFLAELETIEAEEKEFAQYAGARPWTMLGEADAEQLWRDYRDNELAPQWAYSLRLSVLPADLAPMLQEIERLAPGATIRAHAANGVIRIHAESGWLETLKTAQRPRRLSELRAAAQARGGQMVILRAPDEVKEKLDVWGEVGTTARLMRELKKKFDPHALLNPGRFVAGI
jgi:glycolate oxidase FAD binding subunit